MATLDLSEDTRQFLTELFNNNTELNRKLDKLLTITKEIKKTMATQADVDAITAQLEAVKTQVGKIGTDLADFINDNPTITVEALQAKAAEVASALQAVDDILPEATP